MFSKKKKNLPQKAIDGFSQNEDKKCAKKPQLL